MEIQGLDKKIIHVLSIAVRVLSGLVDMAARQGTSCINTALMFMEVTRYLLFYFFDIQSVCPITIINNILKIMVSILFI